MQFVYMGSLYSGQALDLISDSRKIELLGVFI